MPLDLQEKIALEFTRQEWAVIILGLAHYDHPGRTTDIAEGLCEKIGHAAAPIGVLSRVLAEARGG